MARREFLAGGVVAGTAIMLGLQKAFTQRSKSNRPMFQMKYAPHSGMFRNSAGNDIIYSVEVYGWLRLYCMGK